MRQVSEVLCVRSTFKKDKLYDGEAAELLKDVMGSLEEVWVSRRGGSFTGCVCFHGLFCCLYNLIHGQHSSKHARVGALLLKSKMTEKKCFDCEEDHPINLFPPENYSQSVFFPFTANIKEWCENTPTQGLMHLL